MNTRKIALGAALNAFASGANLMIIINQPNIINGVMMVMNGILAIIFLATIE